MKPKWEDAPEWAQWLAMDGDGWWFWWRNEPEWHTGGQEWIGDNDNDCDTADDTADCSGIDWDLAFGTLEQRQ